MPNGPAKKALSNEEMRVLKEHGEWGMLWAHWLPASMLPIACAP